MQHTFVGSVFPTDAADLPEVVIHDDGFAKIRLDWTLMIQLSRLTLAEQITWLRDAADRLAAAATSLEDRTVVEAPC